MERVRNNFFKTPATTYTKGSVHKMWFDRKSRNNEGWYDADATIGKFRYGIIISDTVSNQVGCTVLPIKTDRGTNKLCYEIYLPICVEDGTPGLVCISQMSYLPIESIDERSYGELKEDFMNKIYDQIDLQFGRKPHSPVMIDKEMIDDYQLEPIQISNENRQYFESLEKGELSIKECAELLGISAQEVKEIADKNGFKISENSNRRILNFFRRNYNTMTGKMSYYFKLKLSILLNELNTYNKANGLSEVSMDDLVLCLKCSNYMVMTWQKELYVTSVIRKSDDPDMDIGVLPMKDFTRKYGVSISEYNMLTKSIGSGSKGLNRAVWQYCHTTKPVIDIVRENGISNSSLYLRLKKLGVSGRR